MRQVFGEKLFRLFLPTGIALVLLSCGKDTVRVEVQPEPNDADSRSRSGIGPKGDPGDPGEAGDRGPAGAIVLYDATHHKVGYKFNDGDPADIFLIDGSRALIDMDTGHLKAPLFNFFCMYADEDCQGSCLVYDRRWLGVIVADLDGALHLAPRESESLGAVNVNSYVDDSGSCINSEIGTVESFATKSYSGLDLEFPLPAPLYWGVLHD